MCCKEFWTDYNPRIILVVQEDGKTLQQYYVLKEKNILAIRIRGISPFVLQNV